MFTFAYLAVVICTLINKCDNPDNVKRGDKKRAIKQNQIYVRETLSSLALSPSGNYWDKLRISHPYCLPVGTTFSVKIYTIYSANINRTQWDDFSVP